MCNDSPLNAQNNFAFLLTFFPFRCDTSAVQNVKYSLRVIEFVVSLMKDFPLVFHFMSSIRQQWTWIDQWLQQYLRAEGELLAKPGTVMAASVPRKKRQAQLIQSMVDLRGFVEKMGFKFELAPVNPGPVVGAVVQERSADCAVGVPVEQQVASGGSGAEAEQGYFV